MKKSTKVALGIGAAALAVGAVALAATSGNASTSQPSTPPTPVSWYFIQGHSYSVTVTVPMQWAQMNPLPPLDTSMLQAGMDNLFGTTLFKATGVTQPAPNVVVITFDFIGQSQTVSLPAGTSTPPGTTIQVQDLGALHVVHGPPPSPVKPVQAPGPYTSVTSITPGNTYLATAIVPMGVSLAKVLQALPASIQVTQQWPLGVVPPNWPSSDPDQSNPQAARIVFAYNAKVALAVPPGTIAWKAG